MANSFVQEPELALRLSLEWDAIHQETRRARVYLATAEEARAIAKTVEDKQARQSWENIATSWEHLAAQFAGESFTRKPG